MRFSLIVTVFQRQGLVARMLHCLAAQTCRDWEALFMADGEHRDAEHAVADFQRSTGLPIVWRTQPRQDGVYGNASRREGLNRARGEYVCFLGHDCLIDPDYLAEHDRVIEAAGGPCVSVVRCRYWIKRNDRLEPVAMERYLGVLPRGSDPAALHCGGVDLTCLAFHAEGARQHGVFREDWDRRYDADWHSLSACRDELPVKISDRVVCAHF